MMGSISIKNNLSFTVISNNFIDEHMVKANGEFVKVYLYIQRQLCSHEEVSISSIADKLECTEKDVERAINYWAKEGVLSLEQTDSEPKANRELSSNPTRELTETSIQTEKAQRAFEPQPSHLQSKTSTCDCTPTKIIPTKPSLPPTILADKIEEEGLSQLAYMADTYFGKPLSATELNSLFYFYDQLNFSVDLIEFLIEYCISNGKKNMHYIETVAIAWYEKNITTPKEAKEAIQMHNKNYYSVMKSFGITNRNPIPSEAEFIKKWFQTYQFDLPIVLEACKRTIQKINQPNFVYTDKILKSWFNSGVKELEDIKALDRERAIANPIFMKKAVENSKTENRFHNFDQRNYDFDALEQQFILKINSPNG